VFDEARELIEDRSQHRQHDLVLGRELVIHSGFADADPVGDHLQ
jgi:hypothetical protein